MTVARSHVRAYRREVEAASLLGAERVKHRPRYVSMPDIWPQRLPCGLTTSTEVKTRKALPGIIRSGLEQARSYLPNAVPLLVLSEYGGRAVVVLDLKVFAQIAGLSELKLPAQSPLLLGGTG